MEIEDSLTLAAFNWRGNPAPYREALLGEVGSRYRAAFSAAWPDPGADRSLAFEYFVGLIFNGDYDDLAGYAALVESWSAMERELVLVVPECLRADTERPMPELFVLRPVGPDQWGFEGRIPGYADKFWATAGRYHGVPEYRWWRFTLRLHRLTDGIQYGVYWRGYRPRDGTVEGSYPVTEPVVLAGCCVDVETRMFGEGFNSDIVSAVTHYVASEKAQSRDFPDPEATATAENGYIFANWAADKYGAPSAR